MAGTSPAMTAYRCHCTGLMPTTSAMAASFVLYAAVLLELAIIYTPTPEQAGAAHLHALAAISRKALARRRTLKPPGSCGLRLIARAATSPARPPPIGNVVFNEIQFNPAAPGGE